MAVEQPRNEHAASAHVRLVIELDVLEILLKHRQVRVRAVLACEQRETSALKTWQTN
jgi:hypothetical protein